MSDEEMLDASGPVEVSQDVSSEPAASSPPPSAPAPQQPQQSDVWSAFKSLPEFKGQDDRAIASRLYATLEREKASSKTLQQYQQLLPYTQEYLSNREPYQQWLQQRDQAARQAQQPQQPAKPEAKSWWNPPEVRESYKQYLIRDENGRETISPEAPLDARHALYEFQKYKADFAQKFLSDPQAALGPMVEQVASERAREIVESQMLEAAQTGFVSRLEQENKDWLYEADGKTPTREGQMVKYFTDMAAQRGIGSNPEERWEWVCDKVELELSREIMEAQAASQRQQAFAPVAQAPAPQAPAAPVAAPAQVPPAQNQAQRDIDYLRREASRNPSRSAPSTDPRAPKGPMTFEQRLKSQMARDGIA